VYDKGLGVAWNPATQAWVDPAAAFGVLTASLQYQRSLATAHGKPVSYPEWALTGVSASASSGVGGDDPSFIQGMSNWMSSLPASGAASLAYQSYFNEDTSDGRHRIDAHYFPNSEQRYRTLFGTAASPPVTTKVVTRVTTPPKVTPPTVTRPATISIATTSNPVQGQPLVLTSKATSPSIPATALSGKITFVDGWSALGQSVVNSGVATFTTKGLSPGRHWIWAWYGASSSAKPVVSPIAVRTVSRAATALHAPAVSTVRGRTISLSASVSVRAPGTGTPTGSVQFTNSATGAHFLAAVKAGVARLTLPALTVGAHTFTARYLGSAQYVPSAVTLTVTVRAGS
jgi:hypothetical protein